MMCEMKRFTWNSKEVVIDDNLTGNQLEVIDITEIDVLLDLLNDLYIENIWLGKQFEHHMRILNALTKNSGLDIVELLQRYCNDDEVKEVFNHN